MLDLSWPSSSASMASTVRAGGTQRWAGKARSLSSERWLERALGAVQERDGSRACPPIVECSQECQTCAAGELALLPEGSAVMEMLSDDTMMLEQAWSRKPSERMSGGFTSSQLGPFMAKIDTRAGNDHNLTRVNTR